MRYVFLGTPEFAAIILEKLIRAGLPPLAVICSPDKPVGRKKIITPPPTKLVIREKELENEVEILQPENLSSLFSLLSSLKLDFAVVAAYAKILPKEILAIPRLGVVGAHPSLLPKYRGVSPIQSAILGGEKETGTTVFLIDDKVDHGPILAKSEIQISKSETYKSLHNKLAELSGDLLAEILPKFIKGEITPQIQDESLATYTKKFTAEDALIDLKNDPLREIWLKIRALNPEPGVVTILELKNNKKLRLKLLEADFAGNKLKLTKVQPEGKTPMTYQDFLNGYKNLLVS